MTADCKTHESVFYVLGGWMTSFMSTDPETVVTITSCLRRSFVGVERGLPYMEHKQEMPDVMFTGVQGGTTGQILIPGS